MPDSLTMPPLDPGFFQRTRKVSLWVGAAGLLILLALPSTAVSWAAGLVTSLLIWHSAERVGGALGQQHWRARQVVALALLHLGKYALIAALIWGLLALGWLDAVVFTIGFMVPLGVVVAKGVGRLALPADLDPVPVYARTPKGGGR